MDKPSLAETHPELATQADGWDPITLTAYSGKKVGWKCESGHTWITKISHRSGGSGCPICSGRVAWPGLNDLATLNPELAAQAHGWDPTTLTAGSGKKVAWKCELGHTWLATVANRSMGNGCPICSNKTVLAGFNDLATLNPELAAQAHGWDPTKFTAYSNKKVRWKCESGHTWLSNVNNRANGRACPICSNKIVLAGFNDLKTTNPELATQADGWDPTTLSSYSNKKVGWECELGHKWKATVGSRTAGSNCPICANKQVLAGFNDLATLNPELAAQADGWDPTTVTAGAEIKFPWKCELGHKWEAMVYHRSIGNGCPACSHRTVLAGFNDLATLNPELATQADGWDPTTLTAGSGKKVAWKCELGHSWVATISNRKRGTSCPICSNQQVLAGFNDLKTTNPELAAQADGWDPTTVTAGSNKKAKWICENGHRWTAMLASRTRRGAGCPSCAKFGYDPGIPGFLYLIEQFDLEMFQIGITNYPDQRLGKHVRAGWEIIELRGPMDGYLTQQLETSSLHALEKRGAILGHKAGIDKFDGYSEAWTKASLTVTSIKQLLDWVYEDDHTL